MKPRGTHEAPFDIRQVHRPRASLALCTLLLAAAGGRFIVRHGRVVTSEGTPPKGVFIIAWGSLDKATGYFKSPTFKELIPLRDKAAKVRLFHVEGLAK